MNNYGTLVEWMWYIFGPSYIGMRRKLPKSVMHRAALKWSSHTLRNTIKFKPRLLSYR